MAPEAIDRERQENESGGACTERKRPQHEIGRDEGQASPGKRRLGEGNGGRQDEAQNFLAGAQRMRRVGEKESRRRHEGRDREAAQTEG